MMRRLLCLFALLSSPAWATNFFANLRSYTGGGATAFVRIELRGCTAAGMMYIPNVSGTGVFLGEDRGGTNIFPDSNGDITGVTVQDQSTIACGGVQGQASSLSPIYYHISIWSGSQARPLARTKLAEGDFDVFGTNFNLNASIPKVSIPPDKFGGSASAFWAIPIEARTPLHGEGYFYDFPSGSFKLSTPAGGGGSSTIKINGLDVINPNFNNNSPLSETAFANCRFQASSSSVSVECPQGTLASQFAAGNDSRILNAVPNTRLLSGHPLSTDLTLVKGDVGLGSVDNTSDAGKPVSTAQQAALDTKLGKPTSGCSNATTDKLVYDAVTGKAVCATDQTASGGGGGNLTSLNTLTASDLTEDTANDTNIQGAFSNTSTTNIRLTFTWSGRLTQLRQYVNTAYTDQANTWGAFLQDLSAGTLKLPHTAGAAPATNWLIQGDDTSNTLEVGINGVNRTIALTGGDLNTSYQVVSLHLSPPPSLAPTGQACRGIDASGNCTGIFTPGIGTISNALQYAFPFYSAVGSSNTEDGVPAPTVNGFYQVGYNIVGGVAAQPDKFLTGLGGRSITGSATSDTILFSDNNSVVTHAQDATGTVNPVTLPTATTLGNAKFGFAYCNHSPQTDVLTPTTWTIQAGASVAASTLSVVPGACYRIKTDPNSATNWLADASGAASGGGSMVYPGAGVANSTGSAWGASYGVGTSANQLVQLNSSAQLPAVDGHLLTGLTESQIASLTSDLSGKAASTAATTVNGVTCTLGSTCNVTGGTNTQTSNYTLVSGDNEKLVIMNCSAPCTVTLFGSPSAAYKGGIISLGSTTATLALNSKTFNGSTNVPVFIKYVPLFFNSDGTNYFGTPPPVAGSNVTITPGPDGTTYAASGSGGTGVGRGSGAIDFPSIPDGACNDQTFTFTGVTTSDTVIPGWPSSLTAGLAGQMFVSASDTVKVRLCNSSGAAIDLGSLTYKVTLAIYNLSGSSTINFAAIPDGTCASNTFTLTGVAAGDPLTAGWPTALETGLLGTMVASATDTVQVRLCNFSGASLDPASATFKASVAK